MHDIQIEHLPIVHTLLLRALIPSDLSFHILINIVQPLFLDPKLYINPICTRHQHDCICKPEGHIEYQIIANRSIIFQKPSAPNQPLLEHPVPAPSEQISIMGGDFYHIYIVIVDFSPIIGQILFFDIQNSQMFVSASAVEVSVVC